MRLNAGELFEHSAWRVSEAGTALPHLQRLPQYEGQKAHEDVGLNAISALVPDRADLELILLDAKRRFGLSELDVGLPQLFVAPVADVGAQQIGAFRYGSPVVERCVDRDLDRKSTRLNSSHL